MRIGLKMVLVAVMTLVILVPLAMVNGLIAERQAYRRQAVADVVRSYAGAQAVTGPVLTVPYSELVDVEETARDAERPYLSDVPVGLIATAYGWQATGSTIAALRSIVHALRGWPTPFAAAINSLTTKFDDHGGASDPAVVEQLCMIGTQVARFVPLAAGLSRPAAAEED